MEAPEVQYVRRPDGVAIAYQVIGDGPLDLVYTPGFVSHLDLQWTHPGWAAFMRRLAGFARMVTYDKPGTGLSDPVPSVPTLEERVRDLHLVMDAAGVERGAVMGFSEGASTALMFAATAPERVTALVLYGAMLKGEPTPEELAGMGLDPSTYDDVWDRVLGAVEHWGNGRTLILFTPSVDTPLGRRFTATYERAAASPALAQSALQAVRRLDATPFMEHVKAPTLIMHRVDDITPVANSRVLAARVPGARYVEFEGADHAFWWGDFEPIVEEIEQFLTGARRVVEPDRVLATVLFTDVVDSTRRLAELGDQRWRQLLEGFEAEVRSTVDAFRGRVVKSLGDGHLSVFDGPARAIRCAMAVRDAAAEAGIPVRAGVHTGECEAIGDDVGGMAVHIGARVGALAAPGEVLVSSTVRDLVVGSGLHFAERGEHELKGVPGRWRVYAAGEQEAEMPVDARRDLRTFDRVAIGMASRAPRAARLTARLATRRAQHR